MSDPFAMALAVLHGAAGSVAADYTPAGEAVRSIRVIRSQASREAPIRGGGRVIMDTNVVEIRKSDVLQPLRGDLLVIGAERFTLSAGAELDVEGITWICPLEPA